MVLQLEISALPLLRCSPHCQHLTLILPSPVAASIRARGFFSKKKMNSCYHTHSSFLKLPHFFTPKSFVASRRIKLRAFAVETTMEEASGNISAAPISLPEGGEVTAGKGFNAAGMCAGLRASGKKPDLALVTCDVNVVAAGSMLGYELQGCCCDLSLLQYWTASRVMLREHTLRDRYHPNGFFA